MFTHVLSLYAADVVTNRLREENALLQMALNTEEKMHFARLKTLRDALDAHTAESAAAYSASVAALERQIASCELERVAFERTQRLQQERLFECQCELAATATTAKWLRGETERLRGHYDTAKAKLQSDVCELKKCVSELETKGKKTGEQLRASRRQCLQLEAVVAKGAKEHEEKYLLVDARLQAALETVDQLRLELKEKGGELQGVSRELEA
eukprot:2852798-Rhodomonas_salina.1